MEKSQFLNKYNLREISYDDGFDIEIIYATSNNFTGQILYSEPICMVREKTFEKLLKVNEELKNMGFKLKLWDAFRFYECQEKMWKVVSNDKFVADPKGGKCPHCRGSAVDVTLVNLNGEEVKMPTDFDHFGIESYRDYYDNLEEEIQKNVLLLENIMVKHGFVPYEFEWWHFEDEDKYDIIYERF